MLLKEFPDVSAQNNRDLNTIWDKLPGRLYRTLEALHQKRIPNSQYSISDLEGFMKSLILGQKKPGRFIVRDGCWSLIGVDEGVPSDIRVELVFFPTYVAVSLMTLFWYRYPSRAAGLKAFQKTLHKGLHFAAARRLGGHGMEGYAQKIEALRILAMGEVFRYVVEHVNEHPLCRPLYDVLVDCKEDIAGQFYSVPREIISLREALSILPEKTI